MAAKKKRKTRKRKTASGDRFSKMLAAGLFLLGLGLYLNTLQNGFVFDDPPLITQNPQVTELRWGEILGVTGYRPVRTLTYAVNYALGGADSTGYHLFNALLHALNGVLLFRLLWLWTTRIRASAIGAALFLIHPVQTAAVAYVSGRKDLLATGFILTGLIFYTRFRRDGNRRDVIVSFVLMTLAVLSKEVAIVFPVLLILADTFVFSRDRDSILDRTLTSVLASVRKSPVIYGAGLALALVGLYYAIVITSATRMTGYWGGSLPAQIGTSFKLFVHYLQLVVWPHPLIADYTGEVFPISTGLSEPSTLLAMIGCLAYAALALWLWKSRPLVTFGMSWFLVCLVPVLHIIPFHELAADHFLYLPIVGACLALGSVLAEATLSNRAQKVAWVALVLIGIGFSWRTIDRNRDWRDTDTLWTVTYQTAPGSYRANVNLGRQLFGAGMLNNDQALRDKGIEMTLRGLELKPDDPLALANLGGMDFEIATWWLQQGDRAQALRKYRSALRHLTKAIELGFRTPAALSNLANCHKKFGEFATLDGDPDTARREWASAEKLYREALSVDRRRETKLIHFNLGTLYVEMGEWQKSVDQFELFLRAWPNDLNYLAAYGYLGRSLARLGRHDQAAEAFEASLRLRPTVDIVNQLATAHLDAKRPQKALAVYLGAVRSFPNEKSFQYNLGELFRKTGNASKSIEHFEKAVENGDRQPWAGYAHFALASLYEEVGNSKLASQHLQRSSDLGYDPEKSRRTQVIQP